MVGLDARAHGRAYYVIFDFGGGEGEGGGGESVNTGRGGRGGQDTHWSVSRSKKIKDREGGVVEQIAKCRAKKLRHQTTISSVIARTPSASRMSAFSHFPFFLVRSVRIAAKRTNSYQRELFFAQATSMKTAIALPRGPWNANGAPISDNKSQPLFIACARLCDLALLRDLKWDSGTLGINSTWGGAKRPRPSRTNLHVAHPVPETPSWAPCQICRSRLAKGSYAVMMAIAETSISQTCHCLIFTGVRPGATAVTPLPVFLHSQDH